MRILWVCNLALPRISEREKLKPKFSGGWLIGLSEDLINTDNIELTVCFPCAKKIDSTEINPSYYSFNPSTAQKDFRSIILKIKPDIIHIFGTEFKHSLDCVNACEELGMLNRVIINIQGLTSVYACHYAAGLNHKVLKARTLRDVIKRSSIYMGIEGYRKRGINEIAALKKVRHIIGRTDWDKACTSWINPDAEYHFCNETLRSEFYKRTWNYDDCEKHSIFVSQCCYPIKGFHFVLEAMPLILSKYPDAKVYTTGKDLININGINKHKMTYYQLYLRKLIKKYRLENNVVFVGVLNEKAMCEQFLKANVFLSASTIENSPNSVGEAMILGVPTVSSDVGGVKNLLEHNCEGFIYQHDAPYMLAHYVCELFENTKMAESFSEKGRIHANITHNRQVNLERMLEIYKKVSG